MTPCAAIEAAILRAAGGDFLARVTRAQARIDAKCPHPTGHKNRSPDGSCKLCNRARRLARNEKQRLRMYPALQPGEFELRLASQHGRCALCPAKHTVARSLCVDHDHATGRIRGLLCMNCNTSLGKLGDTVEALQRAVDYLRGNDQ